MRKAKVGRKILKLSDDEWELLEKRFNSENIEELGSEEERDYRINEPCICGKYGGNCAKCSFSNMAPLKVSCSDGCLIVVDKILGHERDDMKLLSDAIEWYTVFDEDVREDIEKIHSFLMSMEKVTEEVKHGDTRSKE